MSPIPPILCGTILAALTAVGVSHFQSISQVLSDYHFPSALSSAAPPSPNPDQEEKDLEKITDLNLEEQPSLTPDPDHSAQLATAVLSMVDELKKISAERDTLLDQLAETNRDVMKMQFQIDTHSESFRPLPKQDREASVFEGDFNGGVLPPR